MHPHLLGLALTISSLALAAPKVTTPLSEATVKALFKKPDAAKHLTLYAVDETCFGDNPLDGSPSDTSTDGALQERHAPPRLRYEHAG